MTRTDIPGFEAAKLSVPDILAQEDPSRQDMKNIRRRQGSLIMEISMKKVNFIHVILFNLLQIQTIAGGGAILIIWYSIAG